MTECCKMMADNLNRRCDQHPNPFDCPDNLIIRTDKGYGLIVHDGGESYIQIEFCPWCGTKLNGKLTELERVLDCIRKHRDQRFDDRCWEDDIELYKNTLPEGVADADLRLLSPCEMMGNCVKYITHRHNPEVPYVSSQRYIEELEAKIKELEGQLNVRY